MQGEVEPPGFADNTQYAAVVGAACYFPFLEGGEARRGSVYKISSVLLLAHLWVLPCAVLDLVGSETLL